MSQEVIYQKLLALVKEFQGEGVVLSEDLLLRDQFTDSVALMEFVISLEDAFNIEIPDRDLETFQTVADLVDYIAKSNRQF
ncbi:phosphopantetheine-binding protein [Streptococcus ovuberis]|uniref:Acyl carrier protein n=1 Tax=Streptococcus ovuberis TaxID=1936207 RepID=A0A7X6RZT2_9STRE|nr:phosphopantetheine-binding protein [Streptococcus ovuberis]NKZ19473.1 acyl carrier protein [Streptococcus ovuberis]